MKKIGFLFIISTCFSWSPVIGQPMIQAVPHVILISIDGFRPDMYLDKKWPTPNLNLLMQQGVYANHMLSVFPAYTYPSHTAMVTGSLPARSGICYNQPIGSKGEWNWYAKYILVPTLWQALHARGLTTAAVMWPGSVGAEITYNMSEIWSINHPDDRITETRKYATPGLIDELERNATGKLDTTNMSDGYLSLDENAGRIAAYIFKTYKPAFLAVHFAEVDGIEHEQGRDGDSVRLAIAANDRAIGDILEAVSRSGLWDSTTVIIVGDHGFSTINTVFRPNILLKGIAAKFIAAGGSAFLYPIRGTDIIAQDKEQMIRSIKQRLDSLPKEQRERFRFVDRMELDRMGADSAAIFALAAKPGLVFSGAVAPASSLRTGPGTAIQQSPALGLFAPVKGGHHGYDPNYPDMYTGFIAAGKGIIRGDRIEELCVTDIAPLVAHLLSVSFPCPDGRLVPGIISVENHNH